MSKGTKLTIGRFVARRGAIGAALVGVGLSLVTAPVALERTGPSPDSTRPTRNRDTYECERDMRQGGYYGTGIVGSLNAQAFQERCLVAKGYYQVSAGESPPPPPASNIELPGTQPGEPIPYDAEHCRICPDCASCRAHRGE
jgi:hypothetical protein